MEDCGGAARLRDIREKFGDDVARIVDGCTETVQRHQSRRGWNENAPTSSISRESPILQLGWVPQRRSKLHNTRAILAELRRHGLEVFERFGGKKDGTVWM